MILKTANDTINLNPIANLVAIAGIRHQPLVTIPILTGVFHDQQAKGPTIGSSSLCEPENTRKIR